MPALTKIKNAKKPREAKKHPKTTPSNSFADLTWADLEAWAGSRIVGRGKNYQREGAVRDLVLTPERDLVAWVKGARRYATQVNISKSGLDCKCTCPFDGNCKHAVAVVLEYLAVQKAGKPVPMVDEEDERLVILEDWDIENDLLEIDREEEEAGRTSSRGNPKEIENYLSGKSKDDLIKLVGDLSDRFPEISTVLSDEIHLKGGQVKPLIDRLRREIREVGSEPDWRNYRKHDDYIPDYSGIRDKLLT